MRGHVAYLVEEPMVRRSDLFVTRYGRAAAERSYAVG